MEQFYVNNHRTLLMYSIGNLVAKKKKPFFNSSVDRGPIDNSHIVICVFVCKKTSPFVTPAGIAVDCMLKAGWTALMYASSCGQAAMVKYLLEKDADPNFNRASCKLMRHTHLIIVMMIIIIIILKLNYYYDFVHYY